MRAIILSVCVFTAACSGSADSPTSPTSTTGAPAQTQAQAGTELPFRGSFALTTSGELNCPPTCPPSTLRVTGNAEGTATHLGRFTATFVDNVDLATPPSMGIFDFTAANGDQLFATTTGREDQFIPPNVSHVTYTAEIVGGTGRFAGATGTLTIRTISQIDFAAAMSAGTGSFEGQINLNN